MSTSQSSRHRPQSSTSPTLVALLAILFAPHVVHATTQLTFFEHSSCNAGTSFQEYNDASGLQADTSCHQLPNGTVALYVNQVDQGCTLRTYQSSNCDPSSSSLAGLQISLGTCFYVDEGVDLGSWRPDCSGINYQSTNGEDTGSSYSSASSNGGATGVITLTASSSSTASSTSTSASTQSTAASASASGSSSASSSTPTATQAQSGAGGSATGSSNAAATKTASSDATSARGLLDGRLGLLFLALLTSLA